MKQGGSIANATGGHLERFIEDILRGEDYIFVKNDKFLHSILGTCGRGFNASKTYTKQLNICDGIYNTPIRCDFMLYNSNKHPLGLVIESKWQQSSGSVDEKFPYLERNIRETYPYNTIVVMDGGGYKPGANTWLRSKISGNFIGVYNMMEFRTFVNNGGL